MERFDVIRGAEMRREQRIKVAHPFADITNGDLMHCATVHKLSDRIEPSRLSMHSSRTAYGAATPSGEEDEKPLKVRTPYRCVELRFEVLASPVGTCSSL